MRRLVLVFVLAAVPALAPAAVYRWVAPDGTVVFSDQPHQGAEKIVIPPANVYRPQKLPAPGPAAPDGGAAAKPYRVFRIADPGPDATVRQNNGDVAVRIEIKPTLRAAQGQRIALVLDGKRLPGRYRSDHMVLPNVDRGTHTLTGLVLAPGGKVLMSTAAVTFHLMRYSRLSAPAAAAGQNAANPNPNVLDRNNPNVRTQNPNVRSPNPNVLSPHPNVLSPHPNVITAPR